MCKAKSGGAQCVETANSFSGMTGMFGSSFHMNGMKEACDCVPEAKAPARYAEYITFIYETYNKQGIEAVPHVGTCKDSDAGEVEPGREPCTAAERVAALLEKKKGKEGKLFWQLVNTYKHIEFTEGLTEEQCEVADRKGARYGESDEAAQVRHGK